MNFLEDTLQKDHNSKIFFKKSMVYSLWSIVYLGLIFAVSACSLYKVDSQNATDQYYSPKHSSSDVVYLEEVGRPHTVIGKVTVNAERNKSLTDVIEKMKHEAAIIGGDAITNIQTDASGLWKKLPAQKLVGNAYVRANFTADVVVFK